MVDQRVPYGNGTRNLMMRWATGEYLAFCDDDDEWLPDTVELIRSKIVALPNDAHIFAGWTIVIPRRLAATRWTGEQDRLVRFSAQIARQIRVARYPEPVVAR
jgi:glycosyltransferase involved in cell wall biosynthesis